MELDQEQYIKIKQQLMAYNWQQSSTFKELHYYVRTHGLRGITFKRFTKVAQNMGVVSMVRRTDEGLKRLLEYNKEHDKYVTGELLAVAACDKCDGTGTVKVPIELGQGQS